MAKRLLIVGLVVLVALVVVVYLYPSNEDFAGDNPSWNGISSFIRQYRATPLRSLATLPSDGRNSVLLVIPVVPFSDSDLDELRDFASSGGTLIVLDDYGYGNEILQGLGLAERFSGVPLLDPMFNYRNKWFPRITSFSSTDVSPDVGRVVLNHASSLEQVSSDRVLARSSQFSFLDRNGNDQWDEGEDVGPLPVAAVVSSGAGTVVLMSDPSILINSMEPMDDNRAFVADLLLNDSTRVFIDQSHLIETSLSRTKSTLRSLRNVVVSPVGIFLVAAVGVTLILKPLWARRKGDQVE